MALIPGVERRSLLSPPNFIPSLTAVAAQDGPDRP
jgi:hypothetical protein